MTPSVERAILAAATIETVSWARFLRNKNNRRTNQTWREFITMEVSPSRNRHHEPDPNSPSISTPFARAELPAVTIGPVCGTVACREVEPASTFEAKRGMETEGVANPARSFQFH